MADKSKRSLGRDVFDKAADTKKSDAIEKLIKGRGPADGPKAKHVEARIKLTPHNIKHLDTLLATLEQQGKGRFSRSELIRVAISLLSSEDF